MQHLRHRKKKQRQKLQKQHHSKHDNNNKKQHKLRKQPKQIKSHNPRQKVQTYNVHTLCLIFLHIFNFSKKQMKTKKLYFAG